MSLHDTIEVNGAQTGQWVAVNRGHVTAGEQDVCRYDWRVSLSRQCQGPLSSAQGRS